MANLCVLWIKAIEGSHILATIYESTLQEISMANLFHKLHLTFESPELSEPKSLKFAKLGTSRIILFEDPSNLHFNSLSFQISKGVLAKQCPNTLKVLCDFEKHFSKLKRRPYCLSDKDGLNIWMAVFGNSEELRMSFFQTHPDVRKYIQAPPPKAGAFWIKKPEPKKSAPVARGTPTSYGAKFAGDLHHIISDLAAVNKTLSFQI